MKWTSLAVLVLAVLSVKIPARAEGPAGSATTPTSPKKTPKMIEAEIDKKVQALLKQMTLEEKVGEMTQLTVEMVTDKVPYGQAPKINPKKLEDAILKYHVGSILNAPATKEYDNTRIPVDQWRALITQIQDMAKKTRLQIPVLYGVDSIHGGTYVEGATLFPQSIGLAATFNTHLAWREGVVTARETRAAGIPWNFFPVLDVARTPLWSRFWETYGEDTYLATEMGTANIHGQQGDTPYDVNKPNKVASCMKHYMGYGMPMSGKDRTPAWIPERALREWYLPPFQKAIEAGSPTIMINSGEIDGIPTHSSYYLLTEVLRKELGFKGLAVSDWEDVRRLYLRDRVADSLQKAVEMAVNAGVDMSMVPDDYNFPTLLAKAVREGKVPMKRIDEAVGRILRVKHLVGLFDSPYPAGTDEEAAKAIAKPDATESNRQAALESITLLKNEKGILPLDRSKKVFVTGPTADSLGVLSGGWTMTWQGGVDKLFPQDKLTILQAIRAKAGEGNVTYVPASFRKFDPKKPQEKPVQVDIDAAVEAAKKADVTVLCLGEKTYTETPGNIDDLNLDPVQMELGERLIKTGKPVILVLVEGRPRVVTRVVEGSQAVLMAYLPGNEGGVALADLLFGDENPSGRLPFSYPRYANSYVPYDHKAQEEAGGNEYSPLYPFGHGLSYTTFEYSDMRISRNLVPFGEDVTVSVTVANTGKRTGKEAVLLYLTDSYAEGISRPVKQLRGFKKVEVEAGSRKTVEFTLKPQDLSFIGLDYKRIVEPGEFKVTIANTSLGFWLQEKAASKKNKQ